MERKGHTEDTKFFIGTEVEHSPAYGQKTLFVIGPQNPKEILARALNNNCPHIYLGANQSYMPCSDQELPYINQFNYNATLKLDDKDFKATNPGVWSHSLHKLQDRKVFTDWSKYTKDEIID